MAVNEEDPPTSREDAWLHRLADQRVQWEDQRVLMEVQLDCLQKVLQAPGTRGTNRADLGRCTLPGGKGPFRCEGCGRGSPSCDGRGSQRLRTSEWIALCG
jgi:hypothetical protein